MANLCFLGPVEVVAGVNDQFDYKVGAGAEKNKTIPAGIYADVMALCVAIKAQMGADATSVLMAVSTGKVTIIVPSAVAILFLTGSGNETSICQTLGWPAADVASGTTHVSPYQARGNWYPARTFSTDTGDRQRSHGGELRTSLDGSVSKRLQAGYANTRRITFDLLEPEQVWAAKAISTHINKDFETTWKLLVKGYHWTIYDDRDVASYKDYYLQSPTDLGELQRPHNAIDYYNLALDLTKKV